MRPRTSGGAVEPRYAVGAPLQLGLLAPRHRLDRPLVDPERRDDVARSGRAPPPSAIAPKASSSWPGTPSLRTRKTSSGAPSARATSAATGTPPRGSPSTMTSSRPAYSPSRSAELPARLGPVGRAASTRPRRGRAAGSARTSCSLSGSRSRPRRAPSRRRAGPPRRAPCPPGRPGRRARAARAPDPRPRPARRSSRGTRPCGPSRPGRPRPMERFGSPGQTLIVRFGQRKWKLPSAPVVALRPELAEARARRTRAGRRPATRPPRARTPDARSSSGSTRGSSRRRPSSWRRARSRRGSGTRPVSGTASGSAAERLGERRRVERRVDEDERPPRVDRTGRRAIPSRSKPGSRPERGAAAARRRARTSSRDSGTAASPGFPRPSATGSPRCRQTLRKARSSPPPSRTRTTGTWPACTAA